MMIFLSKSNCNASSSSENSLHKMFFHVSQIYIYAMAANLLLSVAVFLIGKSIDWFTLPISFVIAIFVLLYFNNGKANSITVYEIAASILVFILFAYMGELLYDFSADGNSYHKVAVGLLKNHWNPFKDYSVSEYALDTLKINVAAYQERWLQGYCKATWIFGASVYATTGNIECGKIYTMLGMFSAFGLTLHYLKLQGKKTLTATLFSVVVAMNPIAISQMDSFYNDGYLHIMLYVLVLSLIMNADSHHVISQKTSASLIASAMIICANIKFTGLLYGGIYCISYWIYYCIIKLKERKADRFEKCIKRCSLFALLAVISICIAGAPTYMTNLAHHHTLTYPLTGEDPEDIMTENSPFVEENHFENLLISLFSKTDNLIYHSDEKPQLKVPFTFYSSELEHMGGVDNRIGGFGIFFSGILCLSLLAVLLKLIRTKDRQRVFWIINLTTSLGLCFLIKESWWARYSPYIYFIFLMGLYFLLDIKFFGKSLAILLSVLAIINSGLQFLDVPETLEKTEKAHSILLSMKKQDIVYLYSRRPGVYFNCLDHGINYVIDGTLEENENANDFVWSRTKWLF